MIIDHTAAGQVDDLNAGAGWLVRHVMWHRLSRTTPGKLGKSGPHKFWSFNVFRVGFEISIFRISRTLSVNSPLHVYSKLRHNSQLLRHRYVCDLKWRLAKKRTAASCSSRDWKAATYHTQSR